MHELIAATFKNQFYEADNTLLVGGYEEPFYRAPQGVTPARICYRQDYASSALHEVAHWCIAGPARRLIDDYGYWYEPDGRNAEQQQEFEQVEVKPQALEWIFSKTVGITFRVSADNLSSSCTPGTAFPEQVFDQVQAYLADGLTSRAEAFVNALSDSMPGASQALDPNHYRINELAL